MEFEPLSTFDLPANRWYNLSVLAWKCIGVWVGTPLSKFYLAAQFFLKVHWGMMETLLSKFYLAAQWQTCLTSPTDGAARVYLFIVSLDKPGGKSLILF